MEFIHAERDAIWSEHFTATLRMLPYIISAGHHKYRVCLVNYLEELINLTDRAPEIAEEFNNWEFTIKWADGKFNCIWTDQALE